MGRGHRGGVAAILTAAAAWSVLSLVVAQSGAVPAAPAPFIPAARHYTAQSIFVFPLFFLCWATLTMVAAFAARRLGASTLSGKQLATPLAYAYAIPLTLTWALPDLVVYLVAGFDALTPLVRVVAPVTALLTLFLATLAVRAKTELGTARAFAAALAGLIAQAVVGGWALR